MIDTIPLLSCVADIHDIKAINSESIRSKLGKDIIRTIRGLGYRLGQARGA